MIVEIYNFQVADDTKQKPFSLFKSFKTKAFKRKQFEQNSVGKSKRLLSLLS